MSENLPVPLWVLLLTGTMKRTAEELLPSRVAMFVAVLFANMHDLLFDIGCSSRISCAGYAFSTGAFDYDLPQAYVVGFIDSMARKTLSQPADQKPLYGANALFATCVWDIFNIRYAAWERFIKYTRLMRASDSRVAASILRSAEENLIVVPKNDEWSSDIKGFFEAALLITSATELQPREFTTRMYQVEDPADILLRHGLVVPELCHDCATGFSAAFFNKKDSIQGISGLPKEVWNSTPVILSAAIRRGAVWATTSECCDSCACVVGKWANVMSDRPVVALMQSEKILSSRDWLLQNYFMGCVAFSPMRLISILAGFDVTADLNFEPGAMGDRDIVDQ